MKESVIKSYITSTLIVWIAVLVVSLLNLGAVVHNIISILLFTSHYLILSTILRNRIYKNGKLNEKLIFITALRNLSIIVAAFLFVNSPELVVPVLAFQELLYFLVLGYIFKATPLFYTSVISSLALLFLSIYFMGFFYYGVVIILLINLLITLNLKKI